MDTLFTPYRLGNLELRNRTIRSAAFEAMCKNNRPTKELFDYHVAVAKGGIGMTTVSYAAVCESGLSFDTQLLLRDEIIPDLRKLTDAIHAEGAKASIQLGHCGNMTHRRTCHCTPIGASGGFNLYSPTFFRTMTRKDIEEVAKAFGNATRICIEAGFDAVEVHAGHGYLISQFLSPYTNRRKDEFGGSLDNRMRFMRLVINKVMEVAGDDMGVIVKMNMHDGFKSGMQEPECLEVAKELQRLGVHALVLSAGFVSKAPMEVMRGAMPLKTLAHYMDMKKFWWLKAGLGIAGRQLIPTVPYKEAYFLEDAKRFRDQLSVPLIYVGGMVSKEGMEKVLDEGFVALQVARALVHDTDFVNKIRSGECERSGCGHSNYCIGRMYTLEMRCHHCVENMPEKLRKEVDNAEKEIEKSVR